jgi:hypothetical protein
VVESHGKGRIAVGATPELIVTGPPFRVQSKGFELPIPLDWRITQPLDSNAAWQTAFDRSAHEVWCEESQRDCHVT